MQQKLKRFLSRLLILAISLCITIPSFCAESNLPMADIGDYGAWTTEVNRELFITSMTNDINEFQGEFQKRVVADYVPPEAKIGLAFMNGLSHVAHVLDLSLVRFVIIFMIIAYIFWTMFEAYTIIKGKSTAKDKVFEIIKKGAFVFLWVAVLRIGPAQAFMMVMSPILSAATYISDGILNVISGIVGTQLPDTCSAIREYTATHMSDSNILNFGHAADIMCLPTRLSGFCYSAIATGLRWMSMGIGHSAFSFLCGLVFVGGFIYIGWRFIFVAFGVIADLFLGVMMLPFTALAETIGKTSYKGILGDIFNGFMDLFKAESLKSQIARFIDAALHFVVLSIVISLCAGLLSEIVSLNTSDALPEFDSPGFFISILILAISIYLAKNASKIASDIGGAINTSMGDTLQSDVKKVWGNTKKGAKDLWKIIKDNI